MSVLTGFALTAAAVAMLIVAVMVSPAVREALGLGDSERPVRRGNARDYLNHGAE